MQKNSTEKNGVRVVKFNDISFPCICPYADYDTFWTSNFNDRTLINVTACYQSSVLFGARGGFGAEFVTVEALIAS